MTRDFRLTTASDPIGSPAIPRRSPRLRVRGLLNTTALVATTALITAIEPKFPRFVGD